VRRYIAARLATAVLVILGVSVVSFFLTFLTGDPAEIMLPPERRLRRSRSSGPSGGSTIL